MKYKDLFDEEDLMSDFNDKDYSKYDIKADSDFRWQKQCLESISNEDSVILSSPTGSGKTRVFLEWADLKKRGQLLLRRLLKHYQIKDIED